MLPTLIAFAHWPGTTYPDGSASSPLCSGQEDFLDKALQMRVNGRRDLPGWSEGCYRFKRFRPHDC